MLERSSMIRMLKFRYLTVEAETIFNIVGLYLYSNINLSSIITGYYPVKKTIIMRKTILIAAAAFMLAAPAMMANHHNTNGNSNVNLISIKNSEINSFCMAIVKGDLDLVKKLIAMGEDVNQKSLGMTPAMFAARYNKVEILKVLIANEADLNIKSNRGHSIVQIAQFSNAKEALEVINAEMQS